LPLFGLLDPSKKWRGRSLQIMVEDMQSDCAPLMKKHLKIAFSSIICPSMEIPHGLDWVEVMSELRSKQIEPPQARIRVVHSGRKFPFRHVVVLLVVVLDAMQVALNRSFPPLFQDFGEMGLLMDVLVVILMRTALTSSQCA